MFLPSSFGTSLATALFSMCCWGSWSNTLKLSEDRMRFEVYYFDFSLSCFISSILAALTLGMVKSPSSEAGDRSPLDDFHGKAPSRFLFAFLAGLVFNCASVLFGKGIGMLGLALAFPICIGTALVLGTLVTYAVQPSGSFGMLLLGVLLAFLAVCLAALAQRLRDGHGGKSRTGREGGSSVEAGLVVGEASEARAGPFGASESAATAPFSRKLGICVVGGILMGLWNPFVTLAENGEGGICAYTELVFFSLALLASSLVLLPTILAFPLEGGPGVPLRTAAAEHAGLPWFAHLLPCAGGFIWCLGTLANAVAGSSGVLSSAESYAIGQCANMVAVFWGVLYFKEFSGTGALVKGLLALVIALYAGAIACVAAAS